MSRIVKVDGVHLEVPGCVERRIRELEAENARLREADARVTEAFAGLLESDPHQYGKRPCQTCTAATGLLGRDFGCVVKAKRGTHG